MTQLYPLTFTPILKDYIWGGRSLAKLGRALPAGKTAESWDIAAHPDGATVVANGPFAGEALDALTLRLGADLIGTRNQWALDRGKFPLLIKLLDANRPLSVQVHPDDDYALAHEGNELGKTEMWVVLHAEPGARVQLGVAPGTTKAAFRQGIESGRLEPFLHYVPVKTGDHVCVPAGTLHALMDGLIIAEIQQNSNTTYRVYDWNRVGADGRPRPLHVDRALDVINFDQVAPALAAPRLVAEADGVRRWELCRNRYFVTERVVVGREIEIEIETETETETEMGGYFGVCDGRTLEIWGVLQGKVRINGVPLEAVQFALLPAALGDFVVESEGPAVLLRTYTPGE